VAHRGGKKYEAGRVLEGLAEKGSKKAIGEWRDCGGKKKKTEVFQQAGRILLESRPKSRWEAEEEASFFLEGREKVGWSNGLHSLGGEKKNLMKILFGVEDCKSRWRLG